MFSKQLNKDSLKEVSKSGPKYKKFKGISQIGHRKELSFQSLQQNNRSSIKSLIKQHSGVSQKNLNITPRLKKNSQADIVKLFGINKKKAFSEILIMISKIVVELKDMIKYIEIQTQRAINSISIRIRKNMEQFMNRKNSITQDIMKMQKLFRCPQSTGLQNNSRLIKTQSINTKLEKQEISNKPHKIYHKSHKLNNLIQLRNQMRKQIDHENQPDCKIINRRIIETQDKTLRDSRSMKSSLSPKKMRSRQKSVSSKLIGLQKKINSIKNILQH